MMRMAAAVLGFTLVWAHIEQGARGENWPRFRGTNGAGVSAAAAPVQWSDESRRWSLDLPGVGHGSPAIFDGKVFVVAAAGTSAAETARVDRSAPHVPTPLAYNGRLFLWSDTGIVSAYDPSPSKGEPLRKVWQQRVGGGAKYFSSPICVGGRLYNIDEAGTVVVLAAGDTFELLARNELNEPAHASLTAADGAIYVRTNGRLLAIGERRP